MHHGIGSDSHLWAVTSLAAINTHLTYLYNNRDKFWVETFGNVARYIRERDTASVNTLTTTDTSITLQVTDNLADSIFNYPLSIRREVPDDWTGTTTTQNGMVVTDTIVTVSAKRCIMFKATPDAGEVVIRKN
jgi:oligosaccharide reducing-end xylanase